MKINFGSGGWKLPGWVNVDLALADRPDILADLSAPLPFRDGSARLLHAEDFLDQLPLERAAAFLAECHRILQPGGVLRVLVPDFAKLTRLYLDEPAELVRIWRAYVGEPLLLGTAGEVVNLGMRTGGHSFMYDAETLQALMSRCGFRAEAVSYQHSEIEELRGLDLRSPTVALSMYYDCYREPVPGCGLTGPTD